MRTTGGGAGGGAASATGVAGGGGNKLEIGNCTRGETVGAGLTGVTTLSCGLGSLAAVGRTSDVSETISTPAARAATPAIAPPVNTKGLRGRMLSSASDSSSRAL
ncbi:hypothetical protein MSIMFB_05735 [Mycobacterium simulans]|uniref:Uncharacterized protein n=1 Tax=Mycobacterium simulans TaxID=627089 RepID=A0A7Z7IR17_9MYCO|nr:hypothetical protein MSIMFB_05735 [Mycobacterium simulans]